MSREEFLVWEARQLPSHEFDGFQPVAMAGGTEEHAAIQRNLAIAVGGRLRGKPCRFYGSDRTVDTGERSGIQMALSSARRRFGAGRRSTTRSLSSKS
jgi:hypothetical protein